MENTPEAHLVNIGDAAIVGKSLASEYFESMGYTKPSHGGTSEGEDPEGWSSQAFSK